MEGGGRGVGFTWDAKGTTAQRELQTLRTPLPGSPCGHCVLRFPLFLCCSIPRSSPGGPLSLLTHTPSRSLPPKSVAEELVSSRHHAGGEAICVPRAARRSVAAFACACGRPSVQMGRFPDHVGRSPRTRDVPRSERCGGPRPFHCQE